MKIQKCDSCKTIFHDKPWIDECPVCKSKTRMKTRSDAERRILSWDLQKESHLIPVSWLSFWLLLSIFSSNNTNRSTNHGQNIGYRPDILTANRPLSPHYLLLSLKPFCRAHWLAFCLRSSLYGGFKAETAKDKQGFLLMDGHFYNLCPP